jgi:hypothetical protein
MMILWTNESLIKRQMTRPAKARPWTSTLFELSDPRRGVKRWPEARDGGARLVVAFHQAGADRCSSDPAVSLASGEWEYWWVVRRWRC